LIESKVDYGATLFQSDSVKNVDLNIVGGAAGTAVLSPFGKAAYNDVVVIAYGFLARMIADNFKEIFEESDALFEVFVVQQLNPLPLAHFENRVRKTRKVLIVEEGSANFGWGSELAYQLSQIVPDAKINRIGARSVPIPSTRELEEDILVGKQDIINALRRLVG